MDIAPGRYVADIEIPLTSINFWIQRFIDTFDSLFWQTYITYWNHLRALPPASDRSLSIFYHQIDISCMLPICNL